MSDNGPQFTSNEFSLFMKENNIKHVRCAPYHPSSNGLVERFNRTFKQALRASMRDGRTLSHRLSDFLLTYRSTPHATTSCTPASLFLNRDTRTRFALLQPDVTGQVLSKQADQITSHDQHSKSRSFDEGQKVMVRDFHSNSTKWIPGTISSQAGPLSYVVNVGVGIEWKRHVEHIRAYSSPTAAEHSADTTSDDGIVDLMPFPELESHASEPSTSDEEQPRYPARQRAQPDRYM